MTVTVTDNKGVLSAEVSYGDAEEALFTNPYEAKPVTVTLTAAKTLTGREMTREECLYACMGFIECVPQTSLDAIDRLRGEGYRLALLSNTNPYVMSWGMSPAFDGKGRALSDYFDACYLSYACRMMKPDPDIFRFVLDNELIRPGELLFVDDGPRNVEVARELGIQAILATDADSWPAEVDRFLQNQER